MICRLTNTLNNDYGYSININNFNSNELNSLLDFAYNRITGLTKRNELKNAEKPYSSLALLIVATSEKNDSKIINILKSEINNLKGIPYDGLKLRRMDGFEIYKHGNYTRDFDLNRGYK